MTLSGLASNSLANTKRKIIVSPTINIFADNPAVAQQFATDLVDLISKLSQTQNKITLALSGGSTPKLLFEILAEQFADQIDWNQVHFFWGDERCVSPNDPQSNFGEAKKVVLELINIPASNVHRVLGESDAGEECNRYETELKAHLDTDDAGTPVFDILILGMGSDGHTASIFPHEIEFLDSPRICEVATHPESGQKRITLTGKVLNAARNLFFLITGDSKATVLAEIIHQSGQFESYPTSYIKPVGGRTFYVDQAAASQLKP